MSEKYKCSNCKKTFTWEEYEKLDDDRCPKCDMCFSQPAYDAPVVLADRIRIDDNDNEISEYSTSFLIGYDKGYAAAKKELSEKCLEAMIASKLEIESLPNRKYCQNIIDSLSASIKAVGGNE